MQGIAAWLPDYIHYILYSLVLILYLKCGGGLGGGGCNFFSHFMLFPTFLEKEILEYKTIISLLMFSSCFFCMLGGGGGGGGGGEIFFL